MDTRSKALFYFFAVAISAFSGLVASSGSVLPNLLFAALLCGLTILFLPLSMLISILIIITFVVQGSFEYFFRLSAAAWIPYGMCFIVLIRTFVGPRYSQRDYSGFPTQAWMTAPMLWLFFYVAMLLISSMVNRPSLMLLIVGFKAALPFWFASLIVILGAQNQKFRDRIWGLFYIVFFLQIPFVAYQHFVIIPLRGGGPSASDAVVGTFGGAMGAGGANSTLVLFALLVMSYELSKFVRQQASMWQLCTTWLAGLAIIFGGEVKIAFIWIPMIIIFVLRQRIFKGFIPIFMTLLIIPSILVPMFLIYDALYWSYAKHDINTTPEERIKHMQYAFDPKGVDYRTGEISRGAALALWAQDYQTDTVRRLIGYGPASSRISKTVGLGEVARRYFPLNVAATSLAMLLWDVGIIGSVAFWGILVICFFSAKNISRASGLPKVEAARLDSIAALFLIFLSMIVYNVTLLDEPSTQLLLALSVGYIVYWQTELIRKSEKHKASILANNSD